MKFPVVLLSICALAFAQVPYSEYVLTPKSRTLRPATVYNINGTVTSADHLVTALDVATTFVGPSAVTYDFGKNVAGLVSFNVSEATGSDVYSIGISFTESSLWISSEGCDATADAGIDQALWFEVDSNGFYAAQKQHQRGGFRYLNVYHNTTGNVSISDLTVYYTAIPHYTDDQLAAGIQTGYFHCEDEQINRIWYAGAYTNELCTIDPTAGNSLIYLGVVNSSSPIMEPLEWYNNYTISSGTAALVDGAKRDRLVWPGDILISQPGIFVSTYDMDMLRDSLDSLLELQNSSGALPYAGKPFNELPIWSFTYHLHSLLDINQYYTYTGNETYLESTWDIFKLALNFSLSFIDESGMANVTTPADWLRFGMGGHNIEANGILYHTLNVATTLAQHLNDTSPFVQSWPTIAEGIKTAANNHLWDETANLYRDNDTLPLTSLHPQDGNAWSIVSNLTTSPARALNVSLALQTRWGPYGSPAPEAGETISPFISGFELQAHYLAGRPAASIALIKLMWGDFMLDDPRMTNSTFLEGYSTDGSLHYAPYTNDPRISHAHGWSTGPTSTLTFYAAGLQVISAAGLTWSIEPQLGGLQSVEAGYVTTLGQFSSHVTALDNGGLNVTFSTPTGTQGVVKLRYAGVVGTLTVMNLGDSTQGQSPEGSCADEKVVMRRKVLRDEMDSRVVVVNGLPGGRYTVLLDL